MDVTIGSKPAPTLEYTLVEEILRDRRRDRRWRIIRFCVLLATFLGLVALIVIASKTDDGGGASMPPRGTLCRTGADGRHHRAIGGHQRATLQLRAGRCLRRQRGGRRGRW